MTDEELEAARDPARREEALWEVTADYLSDLPPEVEDAAYRATIVHWFDADILAAISGSASLRRTEPPESTGDRSPEQLYSMLQNLPFVEVYSGRGHNVHSLTRRTVLEHLWREDQEFYRGVSARAAAHFGRNLESEEDADWDELVEHTYQLLVADEEQGVRLTNDLLQFVSSMGHYNLFHALIQGADEQLEGGRLSERAGWEIRGWRAWEAFLAEDYERAIGLATEIVESPGSAYSQTVRDAARLIASCHMSSGRLPDAIRWYERALEHRDDESELTPIEVVEDRVFTLIGLGEVCRILSRYDEAEAHHTRALDEYVPLLLQSVAQDRRPSDASTAGDTPSIFPVWPTSPEAWIRQDDTFYVTVRETHDDARGPNGKSEDDALASWPVTVTPLLASVWMSLASVYEAMDSYALAQACANLAGQIALDVQDEPTASAASDFLYRLGSSVGDSELARWMIDQQSDLLESAIDRSDRAGELAARMSLGGAYLNEGDHVQAREHFGMALELARDLGDIRQQATAMESIGVLDWMAGDESAARTMFGRVLDSLAAAGYRQEQGYALIRMGAFELSRHEPDSAWRRYEGARTLFDELGIPTGMFQALVGLSDVEKDRLRYEDAKGHLVMAVALARDIESASLEADGLASLADVQVTQRDLAEARETYEQALALTREIGNPAKEASLLLGTGDVALVDKRVEEAFELYEQGRRIYAGLSNIPGEIDALMGIVETQERLGHAQQVVETAETIVALAERYGDRDTEVVAVRRAALSLSWARLHDQALSLAEKALSLDPADPSTLGTMSWVLNESDEHDRALDISERALAEDAALTWVICNRALALLALGRPDEALAAYEEAAKMRPEGEDFENDIDALKRLLERRPDLQGGQAALALLEQAQAEIPRPNSA